MSLKKFQICEFGDIFQVGGQHKCTEILEMFVELLMVLYFSTFHTYLIMIMFWIRVGTDVFDTKLTLKEELSFLFWKEKVKTELSYISNLSFRTKDHIWSQSFCFPFISSKTSKTLENQIELVSNKVCRNRFESLSKSNQRSRTRLLL